MAIGSLDALMPSLLSTEQANTSQTARKHLLLARHLIYGAQMLLHRASMNGSDGKGLTAAASILKLATSVPSYSPGYVDPVTGVSLNNHSERCSSVLITMIQVLWNGAGQILIKESSKLRSMRHANLMSKTREEEQVHALYTQALQAMNNAGGNSTFMRKSHNIYAYTCH